MDKVPVWRRSGLFSMWKLDYGWRKWSTPLLRLIRQRLKRHLPADLLCSGAGGTCCEQCLLMCFRVQTTALGNSFAAVDVKKRTRISKLSRENPSALGLNKPPGFGFFNIQLYQNKIHFSLFPSPLSTRYWRWLRFFLNKSVDIAEKHDHWI